MNIPHSNVREIDTQYTLTLLEFCDGKGVCMRLQSGRLRCHEEHAVNLGLTRVTRGVILDIKGTNVDHGLSSRGFNLIWREREREREREKGAQIYC